MKKFLYLLLLPLVLACGSEAEKAKQHSADVVGVYVGNYNCNGCDIGKWVVNLKDDNTFKITFFDRKTKDFAKSPDPLRSLRMPPHQPAPLNPIGLSFVRHPKSSAIPGFDQNNI